METQTGVSRLLSPDELAKVPAQEYYAQPSVVTPAEEDVPTNMPQSVIQQVPRSIIHPERRTAYPTRSEKTIFQRKSMTPQEYLKKKTFERPGYLALEKNARTTAPYIDSILIPAGAGTEVQSNIQIDGGYDFEVVKVIAIGRLVNGTATREFLVFIQDNPTGRYISNLPLHAETFGGNANEPLIFPVTLFWNRNSSISVSLTNLSANDTYVYVVFVGIRYLYLTAENRTVGVPEEGEYKGI